MFPRARSAQSAYTEPQWVQQNAPRHCYQVIGSMVGAQGLRTLDPLIKSQLLYQLSYAP